MLNSKIEVPQVHSTLEKGRSVNLARCQKEMQAIKRPTLETSRRGIKNKEVKICKILYPRKPTYPECKHTGGFIIDRSFLHPADHVKYLAQPKKVN